MSPNVPQKAKTKQMSRQATEPKKHRTSLRELLEGGDLISPEELAKGMNVARVTIYQWARRGVIPHLKIEGLVRFEPEQIKMWLEAKRKTATQTSR
jgi:excisionase family DNA binding protein